LPIRDGTFYFIVNAYYCSTCINFSRRQFDGLIREWKRRLHKYDEPSTKSKDENKDTSNIEEPRSATFNWAEDVEEKDDLKAAGGKVRINNYHLKKIKVSIA